MLVLLLPLKRTHFGRSSLLLFVFIVLLFTIMMVNAMNESDDYTADIVSKELKEDNIMKLNETNEVPATSKTRQLFSSSCKVPHAHWIGDGYCDKTGGYNTAECSWDGGDCCQDTCSDGMYNCGHNDFDCKQQQKHSQYAFAHRVNNKNNIQSALDGGISGVECDIIWSKSRSKWVVQHDTPNLSHAGPTLSEWLDKLSALLSTNSYDSTFSALWLDIKSPNDDDLQKVLNLVQEKFSSKFKRFSVIYDFNDKENVLNDKSGYANIRSNLIENEGVAVWLQKGEGSSVPQLIEKFRTDGITRSTVSHGHFFDIDEYTLSTINWLNDQRNPYCFKKVFTWTNKLESSMEDYINPSHSYQTDGQIIGSPTSEWLQRYADDDIPDFKNAVKEHSSSERMSTTTDTFWQVPVLPFRYKVELKTGDIYGGGTDSNIFLTIIGKEEKTDEIKLNPFIHANAFERNDIDFVIIYAIDVGEISKVQVRSDGKYAASDWYLEYISINNNKYAKFDKWIEKNTYTQEVTGPPKYYNLGIKTGNKSRAGTDSNIYVTLYGSEGETKEVRLNGLISGNAFERNDYDAVTMIDQDVGDLRKIKVYHDGKYAGSGWYLSYIKVNGRTATFNQWIDDETVYGSFFRRLE